MISTVLRKDIERYAREVRSNPLYLRTLEGTLGPAKVGRYLMNVLHLLRHTPLHLEKARDAARAFGRGDLESYFDRKLSEEAGHDQWAVSDIQHLREGMEIELPRAITPSMGTLLHYLNDVIEEDPILYLSYILFAEYFTILEAPEWLVLLEERCGIPQRYMTAIGNHVELDKDHVEEGLDAIDELVTDPAYLSPMRETLHRSIVLFDRFLAEVAELPESRRASDVAAA